MLYVTPHPAENQLPIDKAPLHGAEKYLRDHGVSADYILARGVHVDAIMETAVARGSNLLLMGGFSAQPVVRYMLGSTVERLLREFWQPILICR